MAVEPSLTQATGRARDEAQMRLNLFNEDRSQQIGMISLR